MSAEERFIIRIAPPLLFVVLGSCGAPDLDSDDRPPIRLEELEGVVEFGRDGGSPLSLLHRVVDGAFLNDEVVILDASPPWVRVFDRSGNFSRSMVESGQGPGEAESPMMLATTALNHLLVHDQRGIVRVDAAGTFQSFIPRTAGYMSRGTVQACGDDLLAMGYPPAGEDPQGMIARMDPAGVLADTLVTFGPVRFNNRRHHPWFNEAEDDRLLFYSEERDTFRLMEVACDGTLVREIPIDSLGPGERWEGLSLHPPAPPLPAGLARIGDQVLWARNVEAADHDGSMDSLTVITAYGLDGQLRRLSLLGWYRILESDRDGNVLLSNTWGADHSWGLHPRAWSLDGAVLLATMQDQGRFESGGPSP